MEIQLITLKETPARESKAIKELQKFTQNYKIHRFKRNPIGWKGCINSHLEIFQYGVDTSSEVLWIAEDNIAYNSDFNREYLNDLKNFMNTCSNWGIIFVGGYIHRPWDYCQDTIYPQIYETKNNNHGTVSYIIHRRLYEEILNCNKISPINEHYDIFLTKFAKKCFIFNPLIFYHAHDIDSNINQHSDIWRRIWFHPRMMKIHSELFFKRVYLYLLSLLIVIGILWCCLNKQRKS